MIRPVCAILAVLIASHAASLILQPSTPNNHTNAYLTLNNGTLTIPPLDPRFRISPSFNPNFLPPIPTLMIILDYMVEIAYEDFSKEIAAQDWVVPSYPQVQITTEEPIKAKFLLCGIFAGVEYMVRWNRFHEALLTITWERTRVGQVWVVLAGSTMPGLSSSASDETHSTTDLFTIRDSPTNTSNTPPSSQLPTTSTPNFQIRFSLIIDSLPLFRPPAPPSSSPPTPPSYTWPPIPLPIPSTRCQTSQPDPPSAI
ncbi:hypothetical protein ACLMJK_002833 [Lecanora helva]